MLFGSRRLTTYWVFELPWFVSNDLYFVKLVGIWTVEPGPHYLPTVLTLSIRSRSTLIRTKRGPHVVSVAVQGNNDIILHPTHTLLYSN